MVNSTNQWESFVKKFHTLSGLDLVAYKRPQMERRINSFMRSVNSPAYGNFLELLANDRDIYRRFIDHLTINVSEFFRNYQQWEVLQKEILPNMPSDRNTFKIWSAGCSTGEEAYSLAIMCRELGIRLHDRILATDIDQDVLEKGRQGIYNGKAVEGIPAIWRDKHVKYENDQFRVNEEIRRMVRFERHDLLRDRFSPDQDLILCRNVVIYFTEETKQALYKKFASALKPGGVLFIGSTEQIFQARELGLKTIATFFYQKDIGMKN